MAGDPYRATCAPLRFAGLLLSCLLASTVAAQANGAPANQQKFDSRPWIEDFHQLLHEMATHYANLEWAVNDRRMDLPDLRRKTENALRHASDGAATRRIFGDFLDAFGDGHLEIEWHSVETNAGERNPVAMYANAWVISRGAKQVLITRF